MKIRPLIMTDEVLRKIKELVAKAAAEPTPYAKNIELAERYAAGETTSVDNSRFTMTIPYGYRVTYTHEHQREDVVCRHISISADDALPNTGPSPDAVIEIIREFGFINRLGQMPTWISKMPDQSLIVELLEPLDGDVTRLQVKSDA